MKTFSRSVQSPIKSRSLLAGLAALSLVAVMLAGSTAGAQSGVPLPLASLADGARVRVTLAHGTAELPSDGPLVGILRGATTDSLTFVGKGSAPMTVSMAQVARLDASEGTRRRGKRGMGLGLAAGALGGGLFVYAQGDNFIFSRGGAALAGAVFFGAVGTVIGGVVGLAVTTDVWRPVDVGASAHRLSVRPIVGAQTGISLRLAW